MKTSLKILCITVIANSIVNLAFAGELQIELNELKKDTGVSSAGAYYYFNPSDFTETIIKSYKPESIAESLINEVDNEDEYNRLINLPVLTAGGIFEPEVIIGADDRKKVSNTTSFPSSAQVLVTLPSGRCSGAMINHNTVITAGHCVHSGGSSGSWYRSARVYPGKNGRSSPFGSCQATKFYSVVGWTRDRDPNYDFGAIKLNCDVGKRTGWMGFWWQSASLVNIVATVSSYPGDKPLEQWGHADKVRANSNLRTYYKTDTVGGNSGSGVYAGKKDCGPCIHTTHAYGSSANNSGTRITRPLFNNLMRWRQE